MALTALAGPVSNFLLALALLFSVRLMVQHATYTQFNQGLVDFMVQTALLSIGLGLFNLIPIPPLDGSKVLFSFMSNESYYKLMRYERYGMIILLALIATDILGNPLQTVTGFLFDKLFIFAEWGFNLSSALV